MQLLNSPFSLLPLQFLGMKSLIRHGSESIGFADTFWSAVFMLFNMPIPPLIDSFTSPLNCCVTSAISSQLLMKACEICCDDHVCSQFCWSYRCCCCRRGAVLDLGVLRAFPLVASLNDAPPPCQMQLCCGGRMIKCARQSCDKGNMCASV